MGGSFLTLLNQVGSMFVMMLVGYVVYQAKLVNDESVAHLSNVVLYVAAPALTIVSLQEKFDFQLLINAGWAFLLSCVVMGIGAIVSQVVYGSKEPLSHFGVIFSNNGFVGIPLVQNLLGTECVFYVSVCIAATTLLAWTYGVVLISGDKREVSLKRVISNPAIVALVVGFIFFLLSFELPAPIEIACTSLANCNTGMAMFVLGCYLAQTNLRLVLKDLRIYKVALLRLVIVPLLFLGLFVLLPHGMIDYQVEMSIYIAFATPCAAMVAMLSQKFGANYMYGASIVSLTTLISMATMPFILQLAMSVLA